MLIALLVVLGVDLIVIVAVLAVVLARKLWVSRQPGAFRGAIRVTEGEVPGLSARWRRGYGRWVRLTDDVGAVRVILNLPRWEDFARSFLDDLIAAATDTPMVLLRLRDMLTRLGEQAPAAGAGIVATRAAWVDDSLARKFPLIWADTATTGHGQLAEQPPGSR